MAKIKLTKGELKRQRDLLKQFTHYLPVLQLKKQQLQMEIQRAYQKLSLKAQEIDMIEGEIDDWSGLLNEGRDYIANWIKPKELIVNRSNIAGVDIPVFERAEFEPAEYDFFAVPLWVDTSIEKTRELVTFLEEEKIFKEQLKLLQEELRVTTQRVNLFEKIKIPECKENVRTIRVYLSEQEINAVGRSKIAKNKIQNMVLEEAFV